MPNPTEPPLLTADLPGIGGGIKQRVEDFEVEECPTYEPCGEGEHLFLFIEKRGLGAEYFTRKIAQRLGVPPSKIGVAGLKDRHAITRQWVSVPASAEPRVPQLEGDGIQVLQVCRHTNKLRTGHLRGNRFRVLIRGADPALAPRLDAILARIRDEGLPNFYGAQRFGRDGETATLGLAMLRGERLERRPGPFLRRLALSAAQSRLFNDYLGRRLIDGLLRRVLSGDVMAKWPAGGMFVAEDMPSEQARFDARETVTAGPIFGRKTFPAAGEAVEREAEVLREAGLGSANFDGFGKLVQGTRRHNLIYVPDLAANWEPDGVRLSFFLPAGSYATVLLREMMKTDIASDEDSASGVA